MRPAVLPDGTQVLATADSRLPFQSILRDKPADALRVFVFGGSATAGLGFSPNVTFARERERIADRDLWKYDKAVAGLDERIERDPTDFRALVYRGNARSFRLDGAPGAAADYRAALALRPENAAAQANLRRLVARRTLKE